MCLVQLFVSSCIILKVWPHHPCCVQHLFEHLQSTEPLSIDIKKEIMDHVIDLESVLKSMGGIYNII